MASTSEQIPPLKPPPQQTKGKKPTMVYDTSTHPALKLFGINQLKPPGQESNYLNWPKKVHLANICYILNFEDNARGTWEALAQAHQDSTSVGRMYWLRKLTLARMTSADINTHLKEMSRYFKNLNSLVSIDKPLTLDNIYSTSLLISLPLNWLPCVSAIMNRERVPSTQVISALKQEALSRKSRTDNDPVSISVSKVSNSTSKNHHSGHKRAKKAGKTSVVQAGGDYTSADKDSDFSGSSVDDKKPSAQNMTVSGNTQSDIDKPTVDNTPVRLADHSSVKATHRGLASLPLPVPTSVPTLVVPSLHKPLLAVSGLCNQSLTVVFGKKDCNIYNSNVRAVKGKVVGQGYRKGNHYYLPTSDVISYMTKIPQNPKINSTLLDFHN
ncbi:hypothetical protein PCASD_22611 [Puccinia coronata f. sp. avenae]|uniref:Uncharacterized protein n=1 Tax=Puccinia coronata f. sp. avenae TaxID=200324 RepID=A0A2N5TRD3_9BASI|nr:hypothetical protein PCASD_22611 [Puccinia coronata f. sp. avenae]